MKIKIKEIAQEEQDRLNLAPEELEDVLGREMDALELYNIDTNLIDDDRLVEDIRRLQIVIEDLLKDTL